MAPTVDLNSDVGEGAGSDEELLALVTSANVCCGAHAGDLDTMRRTCRLAARNGTRIGAHPGYPDREGFGRRELGLPVSAVVSSVEQQLTTLLDVAAGENCSVVYVKPHGALYHRAGVDAKTAAALVETVLKVDSALAILAAPGSLLLAAATRAGLRAVPEGFADRAYARDGSLVARDLPGSVLAAGEAGRQAVELARRGAVRSICIHGDSPGASAIAHAVRSSLVAAGVSLRPFA